MITKIGIQNFKIFQNLQEFDLAKINILTGANGVGKSTFTNAVRFLNALLIPQKENEHLINLDSLQLTYHQKLAFGSIESNFNYKDKTKNFSFSFIFNHSVLGKLNAILSFKTSENIPNTMQGTSLQCFKDGDLVSDLICLFPEDKIEDFGSWGQNRETCQIIAQNLHRHFIVYTNKLWKEEQLCIIDKKVSENHNLSQNEKELYKEYIGLGYKFNAFDINDEKHMLTDDYDSITSEEYKKQRESTILLPNGDYFSPTEDKFSFLDKNSKQFNNDYTKEPGLLFNSDLLQLVSKANSLSPLKKINKYNNIASQLLDAGLLSLDDFKLEYSAMETLIIRKILENLTPFYHNDPYSDLIEPTFIKFLHYEKSIPLAPKNEDIDNIILKSLLETKELKWTSSKADWDALTTAIINVGKNKYNKKSKKNINNPEDNPFDKVLENINTFYLSIAREFSEQLYSFLNNCNFVYSDLYFQKYYFLNDNQINNPLLIFGQEFLEGSHNTKSKSIKFINKWLSEFEIAKELVIEPIVVSNEKIGVAYFLKKDQEYPLIDFGRGINQFVCNLMSFCIGTSSYSKTVFLEEPEVNLHPNFQSKFADMIVDALETVKVSAVIETHSEYFIRKIQYLVASSKHKINASDVSISYLYHPEKIPDGKKQVEKLEIREDGIIKQDFGPGFFDESDNLAIDLFNLRKSQKN